MLMHKGQPDKLGTMDYTPCFEPQLGSQKSWFPFSTQLPVH